MTFFFYDESTGDNKSCLFFQLARLFLEEGQASCGQEVVKEVRSGTSCLMPSLSDSPVDQRSSPKKGSVGEEQQPGQQTNIHAGKISCVDPWWRPDPLTGQFGSILVDGDGRVSLFSAVNPQQ